MLLIGDIGGTKTELAVISREVGLRAPVLEARFASADYASLETMIETFLAQTTFPIEWACFAVAGPVVSGRAEITNLPWIIDEAQIAARFNLHGVRLLNDLEAMAYAVPLLGPDDLLTLSPGEPVAHGAIAVVAPGTGLGEAFLTWDGESYRAYASEGGHSDFASVNPLQDGLLAFLRQRFGRVSYERVCSGIGIPNLYDYLRAIGHADEPAELTAQIAAASDRTPLIFRAALDPTQPSALCVAVIDLFVAILGAEAGNMALKVMATGGVYIGGGIPPRIIPQIQRGLLTTMRDKGRFADLVATMPVHLITNARSPLLGAASVGLYMETH